MIDEENKTINEGNEPSYQEPPSEPDKKKNILIIIAAVVAVCCVGVILSIAIGLVSIDNLNFNTYGNNYHKETVKDQVFNIPDGFNRIETPGDYVTFTDGSYNITIIDFNTRLSLEDFVTWITTNYDISRKTKVDLDGKTAYRFDTKNADTHKRQYSYAVILNEKNYGIVISADISNPDGVVARMIN